MPATAPPIGTADTAKLAALGERIRSHRKGLRVSATTAAEASGISRVTLHRIERGEPSVAMASYISAVTALGLAFEIVPAAGRRAEAPDKSAPRSAITLADYPQLARLAWQRPGATQVSPEEALSLYERNWRHIDPAAMSAHERALVDALAHSVGQGRLLV